LAGGTWAFTLTHWVTITNFIPQAGFPRFRIYLGTMNDWLNDEPWARDLAS